MAIVLDSIVLPDELSWSDEYDWSPVIQSTDYSLTGALIVEEAARQAGRPITLTTPEGGGWTARGTLDALRAKLTAAGDMPLTLHDGRSFTVRWRHGDTPLEAEPIFSGLADPDADALYRLTLRLIEV
ncbi:hypothetical protein [Methylohalobius crimeensis]|uniref:hypothetical protein n=1 Tax=Methylohalobius crimeensis TaxID=244365 RepID=UPI0003B31192|nr:hypothetical protein [Methylohalobius crimeensis]